MLGNCVGTNKTFENGEGYFVQKNYLYNTATGKLHIVGYCAASTRKPYNVKYFDTEDDALAYDGRAVSMCKICMRKREQEMRAEK